jgi:hypothetical protein
MKKSYAIIAGAVILAAIIVIAVQTTRYNETGMQTFQSESQLDSFLKEYADGSYNGGGMMFAESAADTSKAGSGAAAPTATLQTQGRYSTTNNQIATVDEPDFVKNNGNYIFMALNTNISIISAQPATETALISTLDVNGTINEISLYKDMLVVMGSENYMYPALYDEAQTEERRQRLAQIQAQIAAERAAAQPQDTAEPCRFDLIEPDPQADPAASIRAWEARQAAAKREKAKVAALPVMPAAVPRRPAIEVVDAEEVSW